MRPTELSARLQDLERDGLLRYRRCVEGPQGPRLRVDGADRLSFCSNDYLGLANHPLIVEAARRALDQYGMGAAASGLVCGHTRVHQNLEERLADFVGLPRALHFSTGYMANLGVVPALAGPGDIVFSDRLNHASLIDATRLSRADVQIYPHRDLPALERQLQHSSHAGKLVVTDAVFSMDGDLAPLPALLALCERHDAWLLVDDAHGFGVLGPQGRGSLAHWGIRSSRLVYMGTLGKAAGVFGAFVAGEAQLVEWIVQRARTYMFSTASPPLLAAALLAAVDLIESESWRRDHLNALIERLRLGLASLPWTPLPSSTPIQPLVIGDNRSTLRLMQCLQDGGVWVPAIRPPTVAPGTARLRISLSAAHQEQDVNRLLSLLRGLADPACPSLLKI